MNETLKQIEKDAEDALIEAEGGNLNLWPLEENESMRKYWKEIFQAGAIRERNRVIDEVWSVLSSITAPKSMSELKEILESLKIPTK